MACLQGVLDFYNPRENWLARAFAIEYATWFRIMLPGLEKMGLAVPLGGTTLFFRRAALEELGGWDAHNVTEDADLGIRLARHGYRTELIDTVTKEEANCRPWPWVKQALALDQGLRDDLGRAYARARPVARRAGPAQVPRRTGPVPRDAEPVPAGAVPVELLAARPRPAAPAHRHPAARGLLAARRDLLFSEILTIAVGMMAVADDGHRFLMKWVPTLHVYWPLASVAAMKRMFEIATKPFYWDKTSHGHLHRDHDIWPGAQAPRITRPFRRWRNRA
ncbi:MAG: glycosyltransferase family 2 protein [Paracoccaceae bacterium]